MKKDYLLMVPACAYEFYRCGFIFVTRPEYTIEMLPLSWYASVFALCLPVLLAFLAFRKDDATYSWLYAAVKIAQDAGIAAFIVKDRPYALQYGALNGYYSFNRLIVLVSFLLFDVILMIVLFLYQHKRKEAHADNSSSER